MPDNAMVIPLTEYNYDDPAPNDATPGTFGAARPANEFGLPSLKNFAETDLVLNQIRDELIPILEWTRINRNQLEEEWRSILRMEMMFHDGGRKYFGRSDAYLPIWAKIQQSLVSSLSRGLFPSDEYMNVRSREGTAPGLAAPVKTYLQWEFDRVARVRTKIKPMLRQLMAFGNAPMKAWYKKLTRFEGRTKRPGLSGGTPTPAFMRVPQMEGLRVSPRSMLYFYVYPTTAESLDDATVIFEDIDVPRAYITDMLRQKRWINGAAAYGAPIPPNHMVNAADQHTNIYGLTPPTTPVMGFKELGDIKVLTEVWCFLRLPKEAYAEGEDTEEMLPARVVMAGQIPLEVTRCPFWHQRPPYMFARTNVQPGLFYGYGSGRMVKPFQYLSNDFANQTNDCGAYALNPVLKVNPAFMSGPFRPLSPGVVWPMTDVDQGAKFERPPVELIEYGWMMLNNFIGQAQDNGGAPPMLQGTGAAKGAKTATQAQILQRNAMQPLQDIVEDIELDVMIPLMYMTWVNAQQYRDEDVMAEVAGASIKISPEDLAIDPIFEYLASSQAVNQSQRAQQAMQLIQGVMPLAQYLNQLGYVLDPVPLINRVYTDGFGFRGFDDFIKKAQAMNGPPGMPPSPGQAQGAQAEQGDRIRSALEQVSSMLPSDDMAPGEGEEFMNVRANADDMAAQLGAQGGIPQ